MGITQTKKIMIYKHKKFIYFVAPPNYVYKLELPDNIKKKKKSSTKNANKNIFVK